MCTTNNFAPWDGANGSKIFSPRFRNNFNLKNCILGCYYYVHRAEDTWILNMRARNCIYKKWPSASYAYFRDKNPPCWDIIVRSCIISFIQLRAAVNACRPQSWWSPSVALRGSAFAVVFQIQDMATPNILNFASLAWTCPNRIHCPYQDVISSSSSQLNYKHMRLLSNVPVQHHDYGCMHNAIRKGSLSRGASKGCCETNKASLSSSAKHSHISTVYAKFVFGLF